MKRTFFVAIACSLPFSTAFAVDSKSPPANGQAEWIQAAYAANYVTAYGTPELREKSKYGTRVGARVLIIPRMAIVGSYDYHQYDTDEGSVFQAIRLRNSKLGFEADLPLGAAGHFEVQATRQERRTNGDLFDYFSEESDHQSYTARGFGYRAHLRLDSGTAAIGISYELAPLTFRTGERDLRERHQTIGIEGVIPLSTNFSGILTLERDDIQYSLGQYSAEIVNENALLGLRYRL